MRRLLVCVLACSLSGIPAIVASAASNADESTTLEQWHEYAAALSVGSEVTVRITDGRSFRGFLTRVDDAGIAVAPKGRRPEPVRRISFDRLADLEPRLPGAVDTQTKVGIGVLTGVATFYGTVGTFWLILGILMRN